MTFHPGTFCLTTNVGCRRKPDRSGQAVSSDDDSQSQEGSDIYDPTCFPDMEPGESLNEEPMNDVPEVWDYVHGSDEVTVSYMGDRQVPGTTVPVTAIDHMLLLREIEAIRGS